MLQRLQDIGGRIFMNKLSKAFEKGKAFIPFVTAGDPDLETTEKVILAMAEVGADLIEIGIPFSDPVAEGIVIQKADERALVVQQQIRFSIWLNLSEQRQIFRLHL